MPSEELVNTILNIKEKTVDLSNQDGAVDCGVLQKARMALLATDCFRTFLFANNPLKDDIIPSLAAMIKDQNLVVKYDLSNCGITDQHLTLHLIPALLVKRCVSTLILDKNPLSDACVDAICRLLTETKLSSLSLVGINLSPDAGKRIATAVENADDVMTCKLPYSVGYIVLNKISTLIKRNELRDALANSKETSKRKKSLAPVFQSSAEEWDYKDKIKLYRYKTRSRRLAVAPISRNMRKPSFNRTGMISSVDEWGTFSKREDSVCPFHLPSLNSQKRFVNDATLSNDFTGAGNDGTVQSMHAFSASPRASFRKQDSETNPKELFFLPRNPQIIHPRSIANSWADPKVQHSLMSLYLLSERTNMCRKQQHLVREKTLMSVGLDPKSVDSAREARKLPLL